MGAVNDKQRAASQLYYGVLLLLALETRASYIFSSCSTGASQCSGQQAAVAACTVANGGSSAPCCAASATSSLACSSKASVNNSHPAEAFCLSDSAQRSCSDGFAATSTCMGTSNCAPCLSNSAGRLKCGLVVGRALNASAVRWVPVDPENMVAACLIGIEVMTGLCVSSVPAGCSGAAASIRCTGFLTLNFSRSASLTYTRPADKWQDTGTLSVTQASASSTISRSRERSRSPGKLSPTVSRWVTNTPPQLSPTLSDSITRPSLTLSRMTEERSETVKTASATATLTASITMASLTGSMTTRPPTMTRRPTSTPTLYDSLTTRELILAVPNSQAGGGGLTTQMIHEGTGSILAVLKRATWNFKTAPFIDRDITGSEIRSPFAWNEQKEATFGGIEVVPGNRTALLIKLKPNVCYEMEETLLFQVPAHFTTAGAPLTAKLQIWGSSSKADREIFANTVIILTMLLLAISAILGNQGVAVLIFMEIQVSAVLGSQACSRANIADYYRAVRWIVAPTYHVPSFRFDQHFGVVLLHGVTSVGFFIAYVAVCRLRKRARLFFPSLPLTFGYITIIGSTSHAWLDIVWGKTGWRVVSFIGWLFFVAAVALSVIRIRSPRGLQFLPYAGKWKTVLAGTYFPQQLRSKYALLADMWNVEYMRYSSPVHLMHLSFTTVVSAFSWATIVGCFVVMSLQLTWQLVIMLLIVWNRPGRSLMHNTFIIAQAVNQLAIVIAQIISLDCGGVFPQNVQGAEILIRITLVLYFALATAACVGIYFERGHRVRTQSEAQAAEYKMREETLMLNAASTQSNLDLVKSRAAGIPALPNIKFHESQARVSTAESTSVVERQRSLAAGADEDVTLEWKRVQESAEMRELVQASRARRWREHSVEVEAVEEEHANSAGSSLRMHAARAKGLIGPVSHSALPTSTFQETSAGTLASRSTTAGRCRRCLKLQQSLSSYGVCFNCDSLNFL